MSKKTRIKLVGSWWTKFHPEVFKKNELIIEVELIESDHRFIYKNRAWAYHLEPGQMADYYIEILPDEPVLPPEMTNVTEKPFEFRVGDKVKVPWSDEVFELIEYSYSHYPIAIAKSDAAEMTYWAYTSDGKLDSSHDKPVLTLIERPKKTVKKTYWVATWTNKAITLPLTAIADSLESIKKSCERFQGVQFHEITRDELCE